MDGDNQAVDAMRARMEFSEWASTRVSTLRQVIA